MRGQDHQARILPAHCIDHCGGFPQAVPAADPRHVTGLEQVCVVGQVTDHHQRHPARTAHQHRHRAGRVPGRRQQNQAAITEQVITRRERGKIAIIGRFRRDLAPAQSGQVNVPAHQPAQLRQRARQRVPLGLAHHDAGLSQLRQAPDVILVQMGDHLGQGGSVPGPCSPPTPGGPGLLRSSQCSFRVRRPTPGALNTEAGVLEVVVILQAVAE
jgi:hypothetical protein